MQISRIIEAMESIAPPEYAAEWDNVGLLVGLPSWKAEAVLLTIDLTRNVLREALGGDARMLIAYHPPIFQPLPRLSDGSAQQRIALEAAHGGVAVYSPHTSLDAAPDGINDWLARGLGRGDVRALDALPMLPESEQCKVVTFCPAEAVDRLRNALATGGAGRIGRYELCSFEISGVGTFYAGPGTEPRVGRRDTLERVDEVRLEMVCAEAALALAVTTLREFHPYEEPPIEIYRLQPRPQRGIGPGRRLVLDQQLSLAELAEKVKQHVGIDAVRVAVGERAPRSYRTIGLCAGAGGDLRPAATAQGCEAFLTGEMRHHDVVAATAAGCTVILAGHTNTERGYLQVLRTRLGQALPDLNVMVSKRDSSPLQTM
jgi:dinuclear metal center YbgI/SA1388 family protein